MGKINVIMAGLPGNMATVTVSHLLKNKRFNVIQKALTGPGILVSSINIDGTKFELIAPEKHESFLREMKSVLFDFIIVDYSHPSAVNCNAELYSKLNVPFVMGTTGGDRTVLERSVNESNTCAVIAQNMAKQIVGFQAMMEYASVNFPDLFNGYTLEIVESHQKGKADTSGTAKSMVGYFNKLGLSFHVGQIKKIRNHFVQILKGIHFKYLKGHGWHTYKLKSADKTVSFVFTHNVNGRDIYALGTMDAICFLWEKKNIDHGKVFSMIDVLKG